MFITHTKYSDQKMRNMISDHHLNLPYLNLILPINTYQDFVKNVPLLYAASLKKILKTMLKKKLFKNCSFMTTSGTSDSIKLIASSIWRNNANSNTYSKSLKELISKHIISSEDVIVNLFTAGGFSNLYDGCNRLFESLGASILPVGHLHALQETLQSTFIKIMSDLEANVLIGTPSSIISCLNLSKKYKNILSINKIIFTGEQLSNNKILLIKQAWPDVKIYGLYGHTETGFVGINTPDCDNKHYHVLEDWYFIETDIDEEIIITNYSNPLLPLIRYVVGDKGELKNNKCKCGIDLASLHLKTRSDKTFNYSVNLISVNSIKKIINSHFQSDFDIQIHLNTMINGKDVLSIVLDLDKKNLEAHQFSLNESIMREDAIAECIKLNSGILEFLPSNNFIFSDRQKLSLVIDNR
jgi:indoleacetate--lysine synthetase